MPGALGRLPDSVTVLEGGKSGCYTIIEILGEGDFGAVYRARRDEDGSEWAVKTLEPGDEDGPKEVSRLMIKPVIMGG